MRDNIQIYGTDDYEKIQLMHEEWSYTGLWLRNRRKNVRNRLTYELDREVLDDRDDENSGRYGYSPEDVSEEDYLSIFDDEDVVEFKEDDVCEDTK